MPNILDYLHSENSSHALFTLITLSNITGTAIRTKRKMSEFLIKS